MSMIGTRHNCECCGRVAVILGEYCDAPHDHGYIYQFETEKQTRWISTASAALRFRRIYQDEYPNIRSEQ